ncbi:FAD-dependent oxidoreductase [Mucilaginibacter flavus]|uniref:FAD-dependent oxidoreductase n=1 Tax=Mucilaginibacter flavus TaxID=931504 RepID=UPI0025B5462C|nr:FAD-dependent oxidoreductase [Mucilaginibacter flavus]
MSLFNLKEIFLFINMKDSFKHDGRCLCIYSMATQYEPGIARDGAQQSPWQINLNSISTPATVAAGTVYDALVVGGGMTGFTAAIGLAKAGKRVVLAEAHTVGFGTTGGTSAHINTFADTTYAEVDQPELFANAVTEGAGLIKTYIDEFKIDCDYETKAGYLYAETDKEAKQLNDIYEGAIKAGVAVEYVSEVPTPVDYKKALLWPGQAQFQPLKYLLGLEKAFLSLGGVVLENTLVSGVNTASGIHIADTNHGPVSARAVIYATHLPPNINVFNFECAPYRSYVMAVKIKSGKYPEALIYDSQEPYHYVRTHVIDGQELLLVGGLDHKTGHEDPEKAFADLEKYVRKYYSVSSVKYRWSSQYYVPVDGLPYIGQMPLAANGIYCATGYNGNGMMLGSIAGKILSDLVTGRESKYEQLFSPARVKPVDSFTEFVKENADVAYHFVADRFGIKDSDSLKRLQPGTGKVVDVDGEKIAAYRDEAGKIHALSPICTHAACIVNWNASEKSWDCPCHGARYDIAGKVLTGPATKDLLKMDADES